VVLPVPDVDRTQAFYVDHSASFASFQDPDGNGWLVQEVPSR
jgi:predicted lactoylglutathione lyase